MTRRQQREKKRISEDYAFLCFNKEWWDNQMGATIAELDYLNELENYSKRKEKRIEFLNNRLRYLQNKARIENLHLKRFSKRVKNFDAECSDTLPDVKIG